MRNSYYLRCFVLLSLLLIISYSSEAQQAPVKNDSTKIYRDIESYSKRSKFNKFIYSLVFKPVPIKISKKKTKKSSNKKLIQKPYSAYEGKVIRNIIITTLDPFGNSITDTSTRTKSTLATAGNKLHVKSQNITIRNLLLFRKNQLFDSLLVRESERLIRKRRFVNDVAFYVSQSSKNSDSVDIYIRELDIWSISPRASFSTVQATVKLTDVNFAGLGHEFGNSYTWYHTTGDDAYNFNYYIPNINNTYINSNFYYGTDEFRNFTKSFSIDRPFYSSVAKWAGGLNVSQVYFKDSIYDVDSVYINQNFKYNSRDIWGAAAIKLLGENTIIGRTTNFIASIRNLRVRYLDKPDYLTDTLKIYSDEDFYFAGLGISTRSYSQDHFIFRFGGTEDVPVGKLFGLTVGYQKRAIAERIYVGGQFSFGDYYSFGYLSPSFEYGTFFRSSHPEQGVFKVSVSYFSELFEIGKWKFRQFVKPELTIGINRFSYDSLTIKDGYGLDGFNSTGLIGTNRILFTLQTQSYCPWDLFGFRFGPYIVYSIGMLGEADNGFQRSRVYSQLGFGLLIKNEHLVFNTFQVTVGFYPIIPGFGNNVFKINPFKTADFGFSDFEMGKPAIVTFQ